MAANQGDHGFNFNQLLMDQKFATNCVHVGQDSNQWSYRGVIPPITLTTTFEQAVPNEPPMGYCYGRSGNPTRNCLEKSVAALECGDYGLCFSSGLAATISLTHLLNSGDHIVSSDDVYGGTSRYFRTIASRLGVETTFVDARDTKLVESSIKSNTKMIWMETPTNPTLKLCDIKKISEIAKKRKDIIFVVDNTFMSPYFQKPLKLGADIVLHSCSKYINGHTDVIMGCIVTNTRELYERVKYLQNSLGTVPSPFDCFLVNRGIKTLALRMEKHMTNGLAVARFLESHPMVRKVLHPGLKSHPQHELALAQCTGFSGMISFYIKGGSEEATEFCKSSKLFLLAESLGAVESLLEVPSLMTHMSLPKETKELLEIDDTLIRLSVGIENTEDLVNDVSQALDAAAAKHKVSD